MKEFLKGNKKLDIEIDIFKNIWYNINVMKEKRIKYKINMKGGML